MYSKKVIRYYSDCGRGFWRKATAIAHDNNCKCWKNPKIKSCLTCKFKNFVTDSNGMEHEPQYLQTWSENACEHSESGVAVHPEFDQIRKHCPNWVSKTNNPK
jgi:hypothetical protein